MSSAAHQRHQVVLLSSQFVLIVAPGVRGLKSFPNGGPRARVCDVCLGEGPRLPVAEATAQVLVLALCMGSVARGGHLHPR